MVKISALFPGDTLEIFPTSKVIFSGGFTSNVDWTDFDLSTIGVPKRAKAIIIAFVIGDVDPQAADFYIRVLVRETASGYNLSAGQYVTCPAAMGNPRWSNLIEILPLYGSLSIQYWLASNIPTVTKTVYIECVGYIW